MSQRASLLPAGRFSGVDHFFQIGSRHLDEDAADDGPCLEAALLSVVVQCPSSSTAGGLVESR
jgi:hypothetical protein